MERGTHLNSHKVQKKEQQSRPGGLSSVTALSVSLRLSQMGEGQHWPRVGQVGIQTRSSAGSLEGPGPPASPVS